MGDGIDRPFGDLVFAGKETVLYQKRVCFEQDVLEHFSAALADVKEAMGLTVVNMRFAFISGTGHLLLVCIDRRYGDKFVSRAEERDGRRMSFANVVERRNVLPILGDALMPVPSRAIVINSV